MSSDEQKHKMSSSLEEFPDLRIPFEHVASATNGFAEANLVGQGSVGKVYSGQLLLNQQLVDIAARRFSEEGHDIEFWTEVSMLSRLNHKNIISIFGFCDEPSSSELNKVIVTESAVHGGLDKYLSSTTLTWMQRLQVCLGAARALSYLHSDTGRGYGVIHRNIKSSKILLDTNWEAKLCGFGLSISYPTNRRHRLLFSEPCGTFGYSDPLCLPTRSVTHKSDVYSFGVVLFEVLCGREVKTMEGGGCRFPEYYKDNRLNELIDHDLRMQMDPQSMSIFSDTAYHCLNKQRTQRPDMEKVVKRLEQALDLQWKLETQVEGTSSKYHLKGENLEHLKIPLSDIKKATKNFTETRIGSGTYGTVYEAELNHFDNSRLSEIEGKENNKLPKKCSRVAIKRISSREDDQGEQGFYAEIEMLTICKHRNIVSLLGFCDEGSEKILVYELASNGSLDDYLEKTGNMTSLTWIQRIKICLDIAHGLNYLHTPMEKKERIIHRDIKSANILWYENWEAKIADLGLSRFHLKSTVNTNNIAGTKVYIDPEYSETGKLRKESDIYSFGVVLFEIMCGSLAYDDTYNVGNDEGLPSIVHRRFNDGTLKEMIDLKIKDETDVNIYTLNRGPNQDSWETYSKIGYRCLAPTHDQRPTMEVVIKELEKALHFQENNIDNLKFSLRDINIATENFSSENLIGRGGFGNVYKGKFSHANGHNLIVAKRLDTIHGQGEDQFLTELEILFEYKHENVIGLVGYCDEMDEKIIVYEYASRGSLDKYLKDDSLTWKKRLEICIDVATALEFLHKEEAAVIHRDIKSSNILLDEDWKAMIGDFGLSLICPINQEKDHVIVNPAGTPGYFDPLLIKSGFLTKQSDIYSLGVVLLEILCGRFVVENYADKKQYLDALVKRKINEGREEDMEFESIKEMVFGGIKNQIGRASFTTYCQIAHQCVHDDRKKRPTTSEVIIQLHKALELQEKYEKSKLVTHTYDDAFDFTGQF